MANLRNVLLRLTGDPSEARRAVAEITGDLKQLDRLSPEARIRIQDEGAQAKLDKLYKRLNSLSAREATPEIKIATASTLRQIDRVEKGLHGVDHEQRRLVGSTSKVHTAFGTVYGRGGTLFAAAGGLYGLQAALRVLIGTASDVNESLSKNRVLFGAYAKQIEAFADDSSTSFGIAKTAALEYTGVFGNLFRALGVNRKEAAANSVQLTKLAADMASFNNTSIDDALEAIRSGLVGEVEPLRRFGVNLNDAQLRQEALRLGLTRTTKNVLTPYQRSMAAMALTVKQTSAAHGDFRRTIHGTANQTRIAQAQFSDLAAELGKHLLPTTNKVLRALNRFIAQARAGRGDGGRFVQTVRDIAKAVGNVARPVIHAVTPLARLAVAVARAGFRIKRFIDGLGPLKTAIDLTRGPLFLMFKAVTHVGDAMARVIRLAKALANALGGHGVAEAAQRLREQALPRQPGSRFTGPHDAGGLITGSGGPDSLYSPVSPGEFILRRRAVQAIGLGNVRALNATGSASGISIGEQHFHQAVPSSDYAAARWEHRMADAMRRRGVAFAR